MHRPILRAVGCTRLTTDANPLLAVDTHSRAIGVVKAVRVVTASSSIGVVDAVRRVLAPVAPTGVRYAVGVIAV